MIVYLEESLKVKGLTMGKHTLSLLVMIVPMKTEPGILPDEKRNR